LLYVVLISAMLYSLSFLFLKDFGLFIIPALFFLGYFFVFEQQKQSVLWSGFLWGAIVFGIHFIWLLHLLLFKSQAGILLSLILFIIVIGYSSFTSALWFLTTVKIKIWLVHKNMIICGYASIFLTSIIYFLFLKKWVLWFLGRTEGYPFISPLIPLANYKIFLNIIYFVFSILNSENIILSKTKNLDDISYQFVHLPLLKTKNCHSIEQTLFHKLSNYSYINSKQEKKILFVASESFYPFPLNKLKEVVDLWGSAMRDKDHLLIGSLFEDENGKCFQVVYWICRGKIVACHTKTHCVPFVEAMPKWFQTISFLKNMFLHSCEELSKSTLIGQETCFLLDKKIILIPQICSEFFFKFYPKTSIFCSNEQKMQHTKIILFVNDSWFVDYFVKILKATTQLKAATIGVPVLYVGSSLMISYH
jgi:hypothetical protein